MTAYQQALTLPNGKVVAEQCNKVIINTDSYKSALAQIEGIVLAAWGDEYDELAKQLCYQLWLVYKPATL